MSRKIDEIKEIDLSPFDDFEYENFKLIDMYSDYGDITGIQIIRRFILHCNKHFGQLNESIKEFIRLYTDLSEMMAEHEAFIAAWNEMVEQNEMFVKEVKSLLEAWIDDPRVQKWITDRLDKMIKEELPHKLDKDIFEKYQDEMNKKVTGFANVKEYGAKGDGVTDDTKAIQNALDDPEKPFIFFPKGEYLLNGDCVDGALLNLDIAGKKLIGASSLDTVLVAGRDCKTLLNIRNGEKGGASYIELRSLKLNGNHNVDYTLNTPYSPSPYIQIVDCWFDRANDIAARVKTFVSVIQKSNFTRSRIGLHVTGDDNNISTSNNITSCFANNNKEFGYYFGSRRGHDGFDTTTAFVYSSLNNLACDNMENGVAYGGNFRGVTINSCGAEKVKQYLRAVGSRSLTVNSAFMYRYGGKDATLIEIGGGSTTVINGFQVEGTDFKHKVGVIDTDYGRENILINDSSIKKSEVTTNGLTNHTHGDKIFKFTRNETDKEIKIDVTPIQLKEYLETLDDNVNSTVNLTLKSSGTIDGVNMTGKNGAMIKVNLNGKTLTLSGTEGVKLVSNGAKIYFYNGTINSLGDHRRFIFVNRNSELICNGVKFNVGQQKKGCVGVNSDGLTVLKNCDLENLDIPYANYMQGVVIEL